MITRKQPKITLLGVRAGAFRPRGSPRLLSQAKSLVGVILVIDL